MTKVMVGIRREAWTGLVKPNGRRSGVSLAELLHISSGLK